MIERLQELPPGIDGLRARGTVTAGDYWDQVRPLLDQARREGRRVRLVYQLGPQLDRFTAGAVLEDAKVGFEYLNLFDRCAIVTDVKWISHATRFFAPAMPWPVRVYEDSEWPVALSWLSSASPPPIPHRLLPEGVLVVEPDRRLRQEDFEGLYKTVSPWIAEHGKLAGLVVHSKAFPPGWENIGALARHVQFLRGLRGKLGRVALVTDRKLACVAPRLGGLAGVTVRHFPYEQVNEAIDWVQALAR
jgi:hypothetical protein